jgi:pseudouridine-5'-phosphate glycosidase/pseudouridine kinase
MSAPRPLTHLTPNTLELDLLHSSLTSDSLSDEVQSRSWEYINSLNLTSDFRAKLDAYTKDKTRAWLRDEGVVQKAIACLPFVSSFWIKSGSRGLVHIGLSETPLAQPPTNASSAIGSTRSHGISHKIDQRYLNIAHYPAKTIPLEEVVSTTGAGDTLAGGLVAGLISSCSARADRKGDEAVAIDPSGTSGSEGGKPLSRVRQRGTEASAGTAVPSQTEWVEVAMERAQRSIRSRRAVG